MWSVRITIAILGSLLILNQKSFAAIPSDIKLCRAADVACISKITTEILNKNPNGRPDLGLPSLEPYAVREILLSQSSGQNPLSLDLKLYDTSVYGLSTAKINRAVGFEADPRNSKFEIYGVIPKLEIRGRYKANGRILILPIQGDGDAFITCTNCKASVKLKPTITEKDGRLLIGIKQIKVKMEPERLSIHLENLFNGDKALGDNMNKFLNDNWADVWTELSPQINDAMAKLLKTLITDVFKKISYDEFYSN